MVLGREFYNRNTVDVAKELLGQFLVHDSPEGKTVGIIVETEAYITDDLASHASRGQTKRNAPMFGEPGCAYIYFIYGVHWCFNVVTQESGVGEAVLIRALEPIEGIELMQQRRGISDIKKLCNGPAKLVTALGISPDYNGIDITQGNLRIELQDSQSGNPSPHPSPKRRGKYLVGNDKAVEIITTTRVGIIQSADLPLRFYIKDSPFVSRS